MRVLFLAAGAGGMYCGSCLRDNRLAATLINQGHDVHLWPMYTPLKLDEPVVGESRVRFGGINVFLQQASGIFQRTPRMFDRLLDNAMLLSLVGKVASSTRAEQLGPLTVSTLEGEAGRQSKELDKLIDDLRVLKPEIVNLPNLMFLGQAGRIKRDLGAKVVCTLSGEDLFLDALPEPHRQRCFDLIAEHSTDVDAFVAVTQYFAQHCITHFQLPEERMHVVPMGIATQEFERKSPPPDQPFTIGYFARICPEKGLDKLAKAFCKLRRAGRKCRLRIGGYLGKLDRPFLADILREIHQAGFAHDVEHVGEVDRAQKIAFMHSLHVLSVPTEYPEAKGFYILEALAAGVPCVQPRHGSFPELIEATGGGVCYDPNDPDALSRELARLMDDRETRENIARKGKESVMNNFTAKQMAEETWRLFENIHANQ